MISSTRSYKNHLPSRPYTRLLQYIDTLGYMKVSIMFYEDFTVDRMRKFMSVGN